MSTAIPVTDAVTDFQYAILHLSPQTQQNYLARLRPFADWCAERGVSLDGLRQSHLRQYAEHLRTRGGRKRGCEGRPLTLTTQHNHLLVLRVFLRWCAEEVDYSGCVDARLAQRLELPHMEEKVVDIFQPEQVKALLLACKETNRSGLEVRNTAILLVLLDTGVRAAELCGLQVPDCFLDTHDAYLKVHGKGNKWREVPVGRKALAALRRYITRYRHAQSHQTVFLGRGGKPLTVKGLQQMLADLAQRAGIGGVRCSPHTFRHTFACHYLAAGGDLYRLSRLMGHSDIKMTQQYLRAFEERKARSQGISLADDLL